MSHRIEALLFDLGRVVIDIDMARSRARWAELAGVPFAQIEQRHSASISGAEAFQRHERGEISDAEFFAHLRRELEVDLTDDQFIEGWNAIFIGEMSGIRDVLSRARKELKLFAFSNTNAAHQAHWSVHFADLLAPFHKVYVSHEIGARKPEAAAFRAVVEHIGIPPSRILFFDDNAENVAGARACGLAAVHVTSTADIVVALAEIAGN